MIKIVSYIILRYFVILLIKEYNHCDMSSTQLVMYWGYLYTHTYCSLIFRSGVNCQVQTISSEQVLCPRDVKRKNIAQKEDTLNWNLLITITKIFNNHMSTASVWVIWVFSCLLVSVWVHLNQFQSTKVFLKPRLILILSRVHRCQKCHCCVPSNVLLDSYLWVPWTVKMENTEKEFDFGLLKFSL